MENAESRQCLFQFLLNQMGKLNEAVFWQQLTIYVKITADFVHVACMLQVNIFILGKCNPSKFY